MKVTCETCGARFKIDDGNIPEQGLSMECPKCQAPMVIKRDGVAKAVSADLPPIPEPEGQESGLSAESLIGEEEEVVAPPDFDASVDDLGEDDFDSNFSFDDALTDLDEELKMDAQESIPSLPESTPIPELDDESLPEVFDEAVSDELPSNLDLFDSELPASAEKKEEETPVLDMPSLLENAASELEKELNPESEQADELDLLSGGSETGLEESDDLTGAEFSFDDMLGDSESGITDEEQAIEQNALPPLEEADIEQEIEIDPTDSAGDVAMPELGEDDSFLLGLPDIGEDDSKVDLYQIKRKNGKTFGPFPAEAILEMIQNAKLSGDEDVQLGSGDWTPISKTEPFIKEVEKALDGKKVLDTFMPEDEKKATDLEKERKAVLERTKKRRKAGSLEVVSPMKQRAIRFDKKSIIIASVVSVLLVAILYLQFVEEISVLELVTGQGVSDRDYYDQMKSKNRARFDQSQKEMDKDNFEGFLAAREVCQETLKNPDFRGAESVYALLAQVDYNLLRRYTSSADIAKEAAEMSKKLSSFRQEDPEVLFGLASKAMYEGNFASAKSSLMKTLLRNPNSTKAMHFIAESLINLPDKAQAKKYLDKVIQLKKDTVRTHFLLGLYNSKTGDLPKAKEAFSKALEIDPKHLDSQIELAGLLSKDKNSLLKAERELQTIRTSFKDSMSKKQLARVSYFAANIYIQRNETYKVVKELSAAIENEPDNYLYSKELGEFYWKKHDYDKARELLQQCIRNNSREIDCHLNLARTLLKIEQADQALFKLEEANKIQPKNAEIAYLTGQSYEKLFNPKKALEMYEKAIMLNPKGVPYFTAAAMSYLRQDNLTKAGEYIQKAKLIDVNSPYVHNFLGKMHSHQGDKIKAEEEFRKAIKSDPSFIEAHHMLGSTLRDSGKYEEASQQFEEILNLDDKDDAAFFGLGRTYQLKGEHDKAIAEFEKAINLNSNDYRYFFFIGKSYYDSGNIDKAKYSFEKSNSLSPNFADALYYLARVHMDIKNLDKSGDLFEQAILLDTGKAEYQFYFGWLMEKQEKYEEALLRYKQALEIKPDYADAFLRTGITLRTQNKFVKAIKMFNKAKKIDPSINMALLEMGECYLELRKYKKAISIFKEAIKKEPDDAKPYSKLGLVYQDMGKQRKAVKYLKKAVELDVNDPQAHLGLGYAYKALRRKGDAVREFETYLDLSPTALDRDEIEDEIFWMKKR